MAYATGSTGLAITVRGSSRRIMIMRFRPANIRLINRRSKLLRLLLALSSGKDKSSNNDKNNPTDLVVLTRSLHIRPMHSFTQFMTTNRSDMDQWGIRAFLRRFGQDKVIPGNSFVPSYLRPLRNIPYMACSNFLATAMSACRRALFRAKRLSKKAFAWGSQRDATRAGM